MSPQIMCRASTAGWLAVDAPATRTCEAVNALDAVSCHAHLDVMLRGLVRIRASQLHGCASCVDVHSRGAREKGESDRRLGALPIWRETLLFTGRECAALELTEAMARVDRHVADEILAQAAAQFTDAELAELIWTVAVINVWNRLKVTTPTPTPTPTWAGS